MSFPGAMAEENDLSLFSDEELEQLSTDKTWLKLGRYKASRFLSDGYKSDIVSDNYFLAENGRRDPYAELVATIDGLTAELGANPENSVLCQHPARALFINRMLGKDHFDPLSYCSEYAKFVSYGYVDEVSVLFVGSYLSNPGSAFGHLLLRFHETGQTAATQVQLEEALDRAINYGAAASEQDNLVPYIVKGLTGQYRSTFSSLEFYHHSERYREHQLRNIWEYRLDLSEEDVDFLTAHVFELQNTENKYYFMYQNCAYRIGEVVELVSDKPIVPRNKLWVAPMDIFHSMIDNDTGLVSEYRRLASRETLFIENYARLSSGEREFVDGVLRRPELKLSEHLKDHNLEDKLQSYNVLLDRFAYDIDNPAHLDRRSEILVERMRLPVGKTEKKKTVEAPHEGQRPSLVQVSALYNEAHGGGAKIRIRPAYFDYLSSANGTGKYSELSMGELQLVATEEELKLRRLELVRVTALKVNEDELPQMDALSWQMRLGIEERDLGCEDCLVSYVEGGFGKALTLRKNLAGYGLVSGRVEAFGAEESNLFAQAKMGALYKADEFAFHAEAIYRQGIDETDVGRWIGKTEFRFGKGHIWDVRFGLEYDEVLETTFSIGRYW